MKKYRFAVLPLLLTVVTACEQLLPEENISSNPSGSIQSITFEPHAISAISAILSGKFSLGDTEPSSLAAGILISASDSVTPDNSRKVQAESIMDDNTFEVYINSLEPNQSYYYRSYLSYDGQEYYGEVLEFHTEKNIIKTDSAEEITYNSATLKGSVYILQEDLDYLSISDICFEISPWGDFSATLNQDMTITRFMRFSPSTTYKYRAAVKINNKWYYGDEVELTTAEPDTQLISDGLYIVGPATGFSEVYSECEMYENCNDDDSFPRFGLFVKYIVLEADKEFFFVRNKDNEQTRYGANLSLFNTPVDNEMYIGNPKSFLRGEIIEGETAPAMTVDKTGLYLVIFDENIVNHESGTFGRVILVDSSEFGISGILANKWEYSPMSTTEYDNGCTHFKLEHYLYAGNSFDLVSGHFTDLILDDLGTVHYFPYLDAYKIDEDGLLSIDVLFHLSAGKLNNSFTAEMHKVGNLAIDIRDYEFGFSSDDWLTLIDGDYNEIEFAKAEFVRADIDDNTKSGKYYFEIKKFGVLGERLVFLCKDVFPSFLDVPIEVSGLGDQPYEGCHLTVTESGFYSALITIDWDGGYVQSVDIAFTRIDSVNVMINSVVGISGSEWGYEGNEWWCDPFINQNGITTQATLKSMNIVDNSSYAGTYVWELESLHIEDQCEFKLRFRGEWYGNGEATIEGLNCYDTEYKSNFIVSPGQKGDYKLTITIEWDGEKHTSMIGRFKKL